MSEESATATYCVAQPFEAAVKTLRRALAEAGLKITMELNVSERIRRRLLIGMSPCLILFASPADTSSESVDALAPLHIVISAHGAESEIHILRVLHGREAEAGAQAMERLGRLRAAIAQAIGKIGMRVPLGV